MKKLNIFLVSMLLAFVGFTQKAEAQKWVVFSDSISNSQVETYDLDLHKYGELDSIVISYFAKGEIDIDSLAISGYLNLSIRGSTLQDEDAMTGQTLTTNLDSAVTTHTAVLRTLTGGALRGYDTIRFKVYAAASGNDKTDPGQRYAVIARLYQN